MAEVLAQFPHRIVDGAAMFRAQACGAPMSDGRWTAWIEFIPVKGGCPVRSPRETTQPNRIDAEYWATGLTPIYLEGALQRALSPAIRKRVGSAEALFDGPAAAFVAADRAASWTPDAVLDPFSVYQKSEALLRQRLGALSTWHLVNIIRAYELTDEPAHVLDHLPTRALITRIVGACQRTVRRYPRVKPATIPSARP